MRWFRVSAKTSGASAGTPLLAATLVLAACSGSPATLGQPRIGPLPIIRDAASIRLPLDRYMLADADVLTVDRARRSLEQQCLARYLPDSPLGAAGDTVPAAASSRLLDYLDPGQAARYGYHSPGSPPAPGAHPGELPTSLAAQITAIFNGTVAVFHGMTVPPGGCAGQAGEILMRGVRNPGFDVRILVLGASHAAMNDSRVRATFAAWSSCMARSGFTFPTPMAAAGNPAWDRHGLDMKNLSPDTGPEVRTAVADTRCRDSTQLYGIVYAVVAAYQVRVIAAQRPQLDAGKRDTDTLLVNAKTALHHL
jgi:hypothetical protein